MDQSDYFTTTMSAVTEKYLESEITDSSTQTGKRRFTQMEELGAELQDLPLSFSKM